MYTLIFEQRNEHNAFVLRMRAPIGRMDLFFHELGKKALIAKRLKFSKISKIAEPTG